MIEDVPSLRIRQVAMRLQIVHASVIGKCAESFRLFALKSSSEPHALDTSWMGLADGLSVTKVFGPIAQFSSTIGLK